MTLRQSFWRYAHRRYHVRKPSIAWEVLAFGVSLFFGFVYAFAFWLDFKGNLEVVPGAIALVLVPLAIAIMHRRIRIERAKGSDALYRKMLADG